MADVLAMSGNTPNYSGMLFNKGNTKTPFSTMIGAHRKTTNHTEFVTGQEYETAEGSQPEISEAESLTAPDASVVKREQKTNVTQIFQESVGISYGKMSNMGTLSGINVAGQQANPISEEDFQVAAKMAKIGQDIEYTFLNGVYQKSTGDNVPNKSRGLLTAIESNIVDADGKMLSFMLLCEAMKCIDDSNGDTTNLVVGLDSTGRLQLNADAAANGLTIVSAGRDINGIAVDQVLTPLGTVYLKTLKYLPTGTVALFDPSIMAPVEQIVPGKGNFFLEELAKVGAGTKKQIFGQIGLDHGPEWYSAKITNLSMRTPHDEDMARRYVQVSASAPAELGTLTVQSAAGTAVGATKLTVTPALTSGNSYKYKVSDEETTVEAGQNVRVWKSWDGKSDIVAEGGKHIIVAECDKNYEVLKAGSATVTAKAEG
nr:MAG TPA_asm: Major capsid protein [Caudoviricetes sp.]